MFCTDRCAARWAAVKAESMGFEWSRTLERWTTREERTHANPLTIDPK